MARYIGLLDGKAGAYGIVVPDLRGVNGAGATIEDTVRDAISAASAWAAASIEDGGKVPAPRKLEKLRADPDIAEAVAEGAALVTVPLVRDLGRPAKANLSIDAGLLAAIDEAADALGMTRSAFLASAARDKITKEA
jgi:predicted RNase H-like HicB family nuclease